MRVAGSCGASFQRRSLQRESPPKKFAARVSGVSGASLRSRSLQRESPEFAARVSASETIVPGRLPPADRGGAQKREQIIKVNFSNKN